MNVFQSVAQGDAVSKFIALLLLAMSVASWVVILWKAWVTQRALPDVARSIAAFWQAGDLTQARTTVAALDREAMVTPLIDAAHIGAPGTLATAGGVVFTALQDGWIVAYNDDTLEQLWRFNLGTPLKGAPVTYQVGSKQYVAVQTSGRHLHPVKFDNLESSSYMFVFAVN